MPCVLAPTVPPQSGAHLGVLPPLCSSLQLVWGVEFLDGDAEPIAPSLSKYARQGLSASLARYPPPHTHTP